jgi:hypothetical protein
MKKYQKAWLQAIIGAAGVLYAAIQSASGALTVPISVYEWSALLGGFLLMWRAYINFSSALVTSKQEENISAE